MESHCYILHCLGQQQEKQCLYKISWHANRFCFRPSWSKSFCIAILCLIWHNAMQSEKNFSLLQAVFPLNHCLTWRNIPLSAAAFCFCSNLYKSWSIVCPMSPSSSNISPVDWLRGLRNIDLKLDSGSFESDNDLGFRSAGLRKWTPNVCGFLPPSLSIPLSSFDGDGFMDFCNVCQFSYFSKCFWENVPSFS